MEKKKKTAIIVGCVVFILVAVIITLVFLLLRKETPEDGSGEAKTYVIEEGNYQEIMDEMDSQVEAGYEYRVDFFGWYFGNTGCHIGKFS